MRAWQTSAIVFAIFGLAFEGGWRAFAFACAVVSLLMVEVEERALSRHPAPRPRS